jgi:spermidine synthase
MRRTLYITVFFAGMTSLAAEFGASRLLQMRFSSINLVWATIIGLILVYLAVGYAIGGRWADRSPHARTMYAILAWGGFTLGLVPFVAQPVLVAAATASDQLNLGIMAGAFLSTLVLFSVPVTLLAMVSPFAIRISLDDAARAGNVAGKLYSISTIGSVLGAFLPSLLLFPLIGTSRTILLFGILTLAIALLGLVRSAGWKKSIPFWGMLAALIAIILFADFHVKDTPGQIFETESDYNYIEVIRLGDTTYLRLNDGQGVHSEYHPTELFYGGPWEQFLVGPLFNAPPFAPAQVQRIAIIGLAAGTTARQATAVYGTIPIDGYEIDPKIVQAGRDYFGMSMPNLSVHLTDGRWGLEHSPYKYDLIAVDAYRPPYIPPNLTTREFFQICAEHLTDNGVLVVNIGRAPGDRRLINDLGATILSVLPSAHVMDIPNTFNSMLFATKQPTRPENLPENLSLLMQDPHAPPLLVRAAQVAYSSLQPDPAGGVVYTDDLSPVEWVTNSLIINFIVGGGVNGLQ